MSKSADAFRTISEVADWLGVQTHVLRFWESKFTQVKPVKRAGGRRYYRPADMLLLGGIRKLLHDDGLTIKGVQKILREDGMAHVADLSPPLDDETTAKLDSDLVSKIADDVAPDVVVPADNGLDQSPIKTLHDTAVVAVDETASEPTPLPAAIDEPASAPPVAAQTDEEPADIPDLTPDFIPTPEVLAPSDVAPVADDAVQAVETPDPVVQPDLWSTTDAVTPEPEPEPEPEQPVQAAQVKAPEPTAPAPAPDVTAPRPGIIDAPDDDAMTDADFAPSALTKASRLDRLTPAQRDAMRPLLAQLTALRDQMSGARQNQR